MADSIAPGDNRDLVTTSTPIGSAGRKSSGWYGMLMLIVTEGALFLYLQFSYYYFLVWSGQHFLPPELPKFTLSAPNTVILLISSVFVWWGEHGAKKGVRWQSATGLGIAFLLGAIFITIQYFEWMDKPFSFDSGPYGSLYFTVTAFHMAHVAAGLLILLALFVWSLLGYFDPERHAPLTIGGLYWHFVDLVWLTIFFTFYVTPYLR